MHPFGTAAGVIRVKRGGVVVGGMVGGLQAQGRCFFRSDRPIIQNLYNQTSVYFMLFMVKYTLVVKCSYKIFRLLICRFGGHTATYFLQLGIFFSGLF